MSETGNKELIAEALKIFRAKVRGGNYDHYTNDALLLLFDDCVKQAEAMRRINKR